MVFIGGEAGIGKTVLVRLFAGSLAGVARVAIGRCDPLSTPRALGPLFDIANTLGGEIGALLEGRVNRLRLFRGVLAAAAGPRRTVLVLEDLHWADEATLDMLRFLGRRIAGGRGMVIATYRDDEVGPRHPLTAVLGDLATAEGVRRFTLPRLTAAAVEALARGSGLDPRELHRLTRGNPFFVTECLAASAPGASRAEATLPQSPPSGPGNQTRPGAVPRVPDSIRDAVLARASRLSPSAQQALQAAAVIGDEVDSRILRAVAADTLGAIDEVLTSGMLLAGERSVRFRHELARQAILEATPPARSAELHRSTLAVLGADPDADPARLAHHAEAAGNEALTLQYASDAARRASQMGSHREAGAQYARALRAAARVSRAQRADLLEAYAEECGLTDHLERALQALDEAIAIRHAEGDATREAVGLTRRSLYSIRAGRNAEGEHSIRAALELLSALPAGVELARAYRAFAYIRMLNRDNAEGVTWGNRAIALATEHGDTRTVVGAHNAIGSALILEGDIERGIAHLETSAALAAEHGLYVEVSNAHVNLGSALGEVFQLRRADPYLQEGLAYATEHDLDPTRHYMLAWRALSHLYQGRWEDAQHDAEAVRAAPHASAISRITALIALGRLLTRRGDPGGRSILDEAAALAGGTGTLQRIGPVRAARAEAAWLRGDRTGVVEEALPGFHLAARHRHAWFGGELAFWLWTGDALEAVPDWLAEPHALLLAGRWEQAAAAWETLGCPYEQARALAHASEEPALRRAHAIFDRLGARPMAAVVARRLREAGVRNIPRGPRPTTRSHPAGLTARELEVVTLLAQGLRNPEIAQRLYVSTKTVDHHVSSILAKLGVRSRAEVVREAVRLKLLTTGTPHG